jgi:hypothetical protein
MIDYISHEHGETQKMILKKNNGSDAPTLTILLDLAVV